MKLTLLRVVFALAVTALWLRLFTPPQARADTSAALTDVVQAYARAHQFRGAVVVSLPGRRVLDVDVDDTGQLSFTSRPRLFRVASLSKHLVAAAALKLVELNKLKLHEPVAPYFPELDASALRFEGTAVTVHHLLSHTSGLSQPQLDGNYRRRMLASEVQLDTLLATLRGSSPTQRPGAVFEYNNANYDLLGVVIARASGMAYERFLREHVLGPGHRDLGITVPRTDEARRALGRMGAGSFSLDAQRWFGVSSGLGLSEVSGNHYASAPALAAWLDDLFAGRVLKPESLRAMVTPGLGHYGYGVAIEPRKFGLEYRHRGAITPHGFSSWFSHLPKEGITAVALSNIDVESVPWRRFADDLLAAAHGSQPQGPALTPWYRDLHGFWGLLLFMVVWPGQASTWLQISVVGLMTLGAARQRTPTRALHGGWVTLLFAALIYALASVHLWVALVCWVLLVLGAYVASRRFSHQRPSEAAPITVRRRRIDIALALVAVAVLSLVGGRFFLEALATLSACCALAVWTGWRQSPIRRPQ